MSKPFRAKDDFRIRTSMQGWEPSPMDKEEVKRQGWKQLGILVIDVNHGSLTDAQRAFIENIGTKFYGRRNGSS
jgi:hypothetical protein